ncbi:hypothetical protein PRZ48_013936 [Zasmidium cellare]|uniref:BTB domain-containing protein n=1 Tax=Zasmidium cellare TaxID=395010 RepID=A0ABR0DZI1_ZASCE|nr:hypothetical protein PRZ48_013936 [Zasmidium cellare]
MATTSPHGTAAPTDEVPLFVQQIQRPQRFVKIYMGQNTKPYIIQEYLLIKSSPVLASFLKSQVTRASDTPGVLEAAVLGLPEGREYDKAWRVVLFWVIYKRLLRHTEEQRWKPAPSDEIITLARTWVVGEKYGIPRLQNAVMVKLLYTFRDNHLLSDVGEINTMLQIRPVDSPLQRLIAEEVAALIHGGRLKDDDIAPSEETPGLFASLLAAFRDLRDRGSYLRNLWVRAVSARREFMVGEEYEVSWLDEDWRMEEVPLDIGLRSPDSNV